MFIPAPRKSLWHEFLQFPILGPLGTCVLGAIVS
jgi:hypothetical protein